jgi:hypothetical protein
MLPPANNQILYATFYRKQKDCTGSLRPGLFKTIETLVAAGFSRNISRIVDPEGMYM